MVRMRGGGKALSGSGQTGVSSMLTV